MRGHSLFQRNCGASAPLFSSPHLALLEFMHYIFLPKEAKRMDDQTLKPEFFPDFFIVGAPRCGTSALSRYLRKHPQICFSRPKEPHYFANVSPECSSSNVETEYLRSFFPHYQERYKAIGEGSVSYLYSPQAIDLILKFNPDARFIFTLMMIREHRRALSAEP